MKFDYKSFNKVFFQKIFDNFYKRIVILWNKDTPVILKMWQWNIINLWIKKYKIKLEWMQMI